MARSQGNGVIYTGALRLSKLAQPAFSFTYW